MNKYENYGVQETEGWDYALIAYLDGAERVLVPDMGLERNINPNYHYYIIDSKGDEFNSVFGERLWNHCIKMNRNGANDE